MVLGKFQWLRRLMASPFECLRRFSGWRRLKVSMASPFECLRRLMASPFEGFSGFAV